MIPPIWEVVCWFGCTTFLRCGIKKRVKLTKLQLFVSNYGETTIFRMSLTIQMRVVCFHAKFVLAGM